MRRGDAFSTRHRIADTGGRTHWVIVVGDRMLDDTGAVLGTAVSEVTKSRAVIEQAKGVLMAAYGISADRAFDILVWRSQEASIKVRDLAARSWPRWSVVCLAKRCPKSTTRCAPCSSAAGWLPPPGFGYAPGSQ